MNKPIVSIITPLYNSEKYITETILSVQNQTFKNWEYIIVNDCSIDKSLEVVKNLADKDPRLKIISNTTNKGPAISRNKGIREAQGTYLTFIDSDDVWDNQFIEKSIHFLEKKKCHFVFSSYQRCNENLDPILKDFIVPSRVNYKSILKTNPISCLTAFIKISETGKFYMPEINKRQDFGLWLAILKKVPFAYGNKEVLAKYRIRQGSVSRNKFKAMTYQWKIYREVEDFNLLKSVYYTTYWAIQGYIKYKN